MKVQSLLPLHRHHDVRAFIEGVKNDQRTFPERTVNIGKDATTKDSIQERTICTTKDASTKDWIQERTVFISKDTAMNDWIQKLHWYISENEYAQICIDTHLPCYILEDSIPNLASVALCTEDAPQFRLLPDLGEAIRGCITRNSKKSCVVQHFMNTCLPLHKACTQIKNVTDIASSPILLNLLLATLLGLYPDSTKRPPFHQRAHLYRTMHNLLTLPMQEQFNFITQYPQLINIAVFEYIFNVIPHYFPVERECISEHFDMSPFFSQSAPLFDQFRQDNIYTGDESWQSLSAAACTYNQKMQRMYKNKHKKSHQVHQAHTQKISEDHLQMIMDTNLVTQTNTTLSSLQLLASEYTVLTNDSTADHVATVHRCIHVAKLPLNLLELQEASLRHITSTCHVKTHLARTKHVCVVCESAGKPTKLRICSQTGKPVCLKCTADTIISIDTIGKVVYIGKYQYIFMPCCASTQRYTAGEDNIWGTNPDHFRYQQLGFPCNPNSCSFCMQTGCSHGHAIARAAPHPVKPRCLMCQDTALPQGYSHIDHRTARMQTSFLCKRHTPHADIVEHACNFDQFEKICIQWMKQQCSYNKRQRVVD